MEHGRHIKVLGLGSAEALRRVSDNPRVRQIADEKIAKMLNEAAARLEIISHGLMKETGALCSGLAAGAASVKKRSLYETITISRY